MDKETEQRIERLENRIADLEKALQNQAFSEITRNAEGTRSKASSIAELAESGCCLEYDLFGRAPGLIMGSGQFKKSDFFGNCGIRSYGA